jgi:RimJ/RimL family protein N-acetyltransferase
MAFTIHLENERLEMNQAAKPEIRLRPWSENDLPLLERLMGDPAMMVYLGGPETAEQIRNRHTRYAHIAETGKGYMFVITTGSVGLAMGSIGYWEHDWQDQIVWETGWSVLPEFQGQGIATKAIAAVVEHARAKHRHQYLHAFPAVENGASNAICRKAGFTLEGEFDFEYPPGNPMRCNDWSYDLFGNEPEK